MVVAAGHERRENNPDIQVYSSLSVYVQKDTSDPAGNPFIPFHPRKADVVYTYTVGRTQGLLPQRVQVSPVNFLQNNRSDAPALL